MLAATITKHCVHTGGGEINSRLAGVWEIFWEVRAYELRSGEWVGISVIYCCLTNHPKVTDLK